jgi:L-seryl-tRNA(Ser) seleniumtransferase
MQPNDLLRELPSVDRLLHSSKSAGLLARFGRAYVARHCREVLDDLRTRIRDGAATDPAECQDSAVLERVGRRLDAEGGSALTPLINATGTLLHTNLGRALLAEPAIDALVRAARHPVALEYDVTVGERGRRESAVEPLLNDLTGAEAATVVNNNAAAVLLALNTLADRREVVVSRGELIEIGGAFRIPEIMAKSGAILREVGTTNRTHPKDYEAAIGPNTGLLLKVHTSNYRVVGFTSEVSLAELVAIGRRHDVPVMEDLGSGALIDLSTHGLPKEPVVRDRIAAGADVVTFSGDKVLGGPQSGLIVGRREHIGAMASNPLHRALRCDKLTLAALEATLRLYQQAPDVLAAIPALQALARPLEEVDAAARQVAARLRETLGPGYRVEVEDSTSQVGSGALPTEEIPTRVVVVSHDRLSAGSIAARFRRAHPPIIGRIKDDRFLLDVRTVSRPADLIPAW